jgi:UDP:flavonoid glycosyltransferase YjiC (YdhE family)
VVPSSHDQFDTAWRIVRLGLGRSLPRTRYRAMHAASEMRAVLEDGGTAGRTRDFSTRVDSVSAIARACELIENLAGSDSVTSCTHGRSSVASMGRYLE